MSSYRIVIPHFERPTKAIGYVCVFWAWLEDAIGELILDLAPLDSKRLIPKEREQLRDVLLLDTDIRTKIKMLKATAFIRSFDDAWLKQMHKLLDHIDNDIRPRRNRIVHSSWFSPKGRLQRFRKFAALKKPQSFAKAQLATNERVPVKMKELWQLGNDIVRAEWKLVGLQLKHQAGQKYIDEQIEQIEGDHWMSVIGGVLAKRTDLLPALIAKSMQPTSRPASGGTRRKNVPSKRGPRRRSSGKKPPP